MEKSLRFLASTDIYALDMALGVICRRA